MNRRLLAGLMLCIGGCGTIGNELMAQPSSGRHHTNCPAPWAAPLSISSELTNKDQSRDGNVARLLVHGSPSERAFNERRR